MRRPTAPNMTRAGWRRWLMPVAALVVAYALLDDSTGRDFDRASFATTLSEGRVDQALELITHAGNAHLLPSLSGVNWWPRSSRSARLDMLRGDVARAPQNTGPVLVAPAGRYRIGPGQALLEQPAEHDLKLQVHLRDLGMQAHEVRIPAGQRQVDLDLTWLAGTTYDLVLMDADEDGMASIAHVELLSETMSHDLGTVLATAYDLAPDAASGELLAGIVALHYGLYDEARQRWLGLLDTPAHGRVALELTVIALARQNRDGEALALLRDG